MAKPTQAQAVTILDRIIDKGRANAAAVIEEIQMSRPQDAVVSSGAVRITDTLGAVIGATEMRMHDNALAQAMGRADIPVRFGRRLQGTEWGRALLAHNLNETFHHDEQRVLLRAVRGEIRAFLSDSYRRLDAAPIVDAFASAMKALGGIPVGGVVSDLRLSLRAILPEIVWIGDDPVVMGAELRTSDYGHGTLGTHLWTTRVWCDNGATGDNILKAVHLGRRIEGESDTFSQRTHDFDTQTMASAVQDLIGAQLGPVAIASRKAVLDRAASTEIDSKAAFVELGKVLTKRETEAAIEVFTFGEEDKVPEGKTAWRLSNAISWVSKSTESQERRLDLERIAGELLQAHAAKASLLAEVIA